MSKIRSFYLHSKNKFMPIAAYKDGLISESFSLIGSNLIKWVPNYYPEHYPPKEKILKGHSSYRKFACMSLNGFVPKEFNQNYYIKETERSWEALGCPVIHLSFAYKRVSFLWRHIDLCRFCTFF